MIREANPGALKLPKGSMERERTQILEARVIALEAKVGALASALAQSLEPDSDEPKTGEPTKGKPGRKPKAQE